MSEETQEDMTMQWVPPEDMDEECITLCVAMNKLPGIETICSCCGHGRTPYRIWFKIKEDSPEGLLEGLPKLLYWIRHHLDDCHKSRWQVFVTTDCTGFEATFRLEGPTGEQAYRDAAHISELVQKEADAS